MASSKETSAAVAAFPFMDLPTELRIKIYGLCLEAPKEVRLRLPAELAVAQNYPQRRVRPALPILDTTILRVSRGIYEEASSVFYARNRFHYTTQKSVTCWPPPFSVHLSMMRHISLEHNEPSLCEELFKRYYVPMNDLTIGHLVMQLVRHPAQLRRFSLYITAAPNFGLNRALIMNNANAIALRRLRARLDRLTFVTYGPDNSLEALRMFLAPEIEWSRQKFRDWPRITMHWTAFTTIYLSILFDEF